MMKSTLDAIYSHSTAPRNVLTFNRNRLSNAISLLQATVVERYQLAAISGGLSVAWKPAPIPTTRRLPVRGPGTYKIKLVRIGVKVYMYVGKGDAEPVKIANTEVTFQNPVLVGLSVCAHQPDATATVLFWDVSVDEQPTPAPNAR